MNTQTTSRPEDTLSAIVTVLKPRWGWIVASGIVTLIFGLLAFRMPLGAVFAMTLLFGAYALADGVLSVIAAIQSRRDADTSNDRNFWPLLARGVLGIFAGVIVLVLPGLSVVSLTAFTWAMLSIWAIATGILEIMAAVRLRKEMKGEWLLALSGLVSLAAGVAIPVILLQNPAASIITMGWLIGFYALAHGVLEVGLGLSLRKFSA
ncbi:MAG TPA: HdeD family acid-resistance protein [Aliiroseovarius sp.]|nr:HdeD family acid-resistance protein [Aliiroseovarius sp.]